MGEEGGRKHWVPEEGGRPRIKEGGRPRIEEGGKSRMDKGERGRPRIEEE